MLHSLSPLHRRAAILKPESPKKDAPADQLDNAVHAKGGQKHAPSGHPSADRQHGFDNHPKDRKGLEADGRSKNITARGGFHLALRSIVGAKIDSVTGKRHYGFSSPEDLNHFRRCDSIENLTALGSIGDKTAILQASEVTGNIPLRAAERLNEISDTQLLIGQLY